ncbi:MAG: ATP-binding protein [Flavobacteriales bacterium]|nr:ATP-binding protein [Flavobacteriales bacterium]
MDNELFKSLISQTESYTLDFKRIQYALIGDKSGNGTAKFVKDIVSFANTVREKCSYIIIGIDDNSKQKELMGLDTFLDEGIFQSKIKNKVYPIPKFSYYSFEYDDKHYGIVKIPVTKYAEPITPVVKMKGLEVGKVYLRRGSTNEEASAREVIEVSDWLRSLKVMQNTDELKSEIIDIISAISDSSQYFSTHLPKVLKISQERGNKELELICRSELQGWKASPEHEDACTHRLIKTFFSFANVTGVNYSGSNRVLKMWEELRGDENFKEITMLYGDPISTIENAIEGYKPNIEQFNTLPLKGKDIIPGKGFDELPVYIYMNYYLFKDLYSSIRHKLVSELTNMI